MKKNIRLALILLLAMPMFSFTGTRSSTGPTAARKSNPYYAFAYDAVPQGNNVYSVTIYFLKVDSVTFTSTYVNAPVNISISGTFPSVGPTSFTFPAGSNSLNVGNFTFSSPPTQAIPITTDPSTILGLSVSDLLTDINIP